jgi:sialate O-acetylesterase
MKALICGGLIASLVVCSGAAVFAGELALARPFASHMVLPMAKAVPVWGGAMPGEEVTVAFAGESASVLADRDGRWQVVLPAMPASAKGRTLSVTAGRAKVVLDDVLVGRVFLCSGQSNMDFPLSRATGGIEEARTAGKFPAIRLFNLTGAPTDSRVYDAATLARLNPFDHFTGSWERSSEKSAAAFSAVAWWAGKAVHLKDGVPVGLVENAVGGSGTEAWLAPSVLAARREYADLLDERWLGSLRVSAWARGRARKNLGAHPEASHPFKPGFLFESGVRAWAGFPFEGVLWYQGETNAEIDDDAWNRRLISDLVGGWRKELRQQKLPFFLIQLPRIGGSDPLRRHWPAYRKVQADVARNLSGVELVVTHDLGWDSPDVHPPDKQPVGMRLAGAMLKARAR